MLPVVPSVSFLFLSEGGTQKFGSVEGDPEANRLGEDRVPLTVAATATRSLSAAILYMDEKATCGDARA